MWDFTTRYLWVPKAISTKSSPPPRLVPEGFGSHWQVCTSILSHIQAFFEVRHTIRGQHPWLRMNDDYIRAVLRKPVAAFN